MQSERSEEIDVAAAVWVARMDRGPLSAADEQLLESWLTGDIRRRGAFMRLRAVALHSERAIALGPTFDPDSLIEIDEVAAHADYDARRENISVNRRRALLCVGSAMAAFATGIVSVMQRDGPSRHSTHVGEVKVVTLGDGSVMTLDTRTQASVDFGKTNRMISLEDGQALFDVAKNRDRPFIVDAAGVRVRAIGTSFAVRRGAAGDVEVLVREGIVEVTSPTSPKPVRATANMRVVVGRGRLVAIAHPDELSPGEIDRELAWKSGRIALEGKTLDEAAAIFARYSDTRILIADRKLGSEEISGLFIANDPVAFARATADSLGLKTRVSEGTITLSR